MSNFINHHTIGFEVSLFGLDHPTFALPERHFVNQHRMQPPFPLRMDVIFLGMGCFWGAERLFWQRKGVWVTAAGYMGGHTAYPVYEEVCSGKTGHAEVVMIVFDPAAITCKSIVNLFFEQHDPTQGWRQGNDTGSQYRSVIYTSAEQQQTTAQQQRSACQRALTAMNKGTITTEISRATCFYYAEPFHQQYLAKYPTGYCGLSGTGIVME
ncbi:Peptide methionine sulfoxide reductase MsrA [invertebrate metagenome]|uniref:peptide-methionine (S)-S-oxide reductase n=1 Tax=invertebrate metagenome TaxID=1711999 RepID=A0A2H9TAL2_9ZZZZ